MAAHVSFFDCGIFWRTTVNRYMLIYIWCDSTNESAERIGARAGPAPFRSSNGAGPTPAPFRCFGVDSYLQNSIMTIEDQNGVDRVDRKALRPHFLNKGTRFYNVAQRVTSMRWGRRCWDSVFLHSCRFLYYPPLDKNETALHCREGRFFRLLHENRGLLRSLSGDTKGGEHWRKTALL